MPAPRAALPVALTLFAVVACRVSTQQNELYEGDQLAESAQASRPSPSRTASAELDASQSLDDDASSDGSSDAEPFVAPPCTPLAIASNAPTTACEVEPYALTGGTVPLGGFNLLRWSEDKCGYVGSQRRGSMSLEEHGGKTFMRWIVEVDGKTSWGTYELTRKSPTAFLRREVCNWSSQTPDVLVNYVVAATEIKFVHDRGHETWVRPPKMPPPATVPVEPVATQ